MIRSVEKTNDLIGNPTHDFPAYSIVPLPTTLLRNPQRKTANVRADPRGMKCELLFIEVEWK
jgi:hypothetical protein